MEDLNSPTRIRTSTPIPITTPTTTTPETDTETPSPTKKPIDHHYSKILSFNNGAVKHHHPKTQSVVVVVVYKECLKNHAANLGGHALDGCGEFMPSPSSTPINPTSLKCAACGCHRNFHRREPDEGTLVVEYPSPHNNNNHNPVPHLSPSPPVRYRSPNSSVSPPPVSSTYYPSAPHMLLALSAGLSGPSDHQRKTVNNNNNNNTSNKVRTTTTTTPTVTGSINCNGGRKRFRTKFSQEQKEKMQNFSERLGWKMQKRDESLIKEFCNEVGVGKSILKVWMHNNKHTFGKTNNNCFSSINLHTNITTSPTHKNNNPS